MLVFLQPGYMRVNRAQKSQSQAVACYYLNVQGVRWCDLFHARCDVGVPSGPAGCAAADIGEGGYFVRC